jgi:hypothetical protein
MLLYGCNRISRCKNSNNFPKYQIFDKKVYKSD